jgi:endonuclease III
MHRRDTIGAMPTASASSALKARARTIYRKLHRQYPRAECALHHRSAWELLVATILSAQCTDDRVNMVTPGLLARYPDARAMSRAEQADVEQLIRSTGFFRSKASSLIATAQTVVERFGGEVPRTMEDLLELRGVARKTANVVLGNAFGINEGIPVDTHVTRVSFRLGLTRQTDPKKIEQDLMTLYARKDWAMISHLLIWHGRRTCDARKPDCEHCVVNNECPKKGVRTSGGVRRPRRT